MGRPAVVHIASTHRPYDGRIFQKECRALARAGYAITYIVPHTHDEERDGVQIQAVPLPATGRDRLTQTLQQLYEAARAMPSDALLHFHDAELLPYMLRLKRQGRRVIYDAHEDTPRQVMHMAWIPAFARPLVAQLMRYWEWQAGRHFDGVIAAVPSIAERFPKDKTVTVYNYPEYVAALPDDVLPYAERERRAVYIGGLSEARGLREMLAASGLVPGLAIDLAGAYYPQALQETSQAWPGAETRRYHGWLSQVEVQQLLHQTRMGLVVLHPTPQYLVSEPTKLYEYMMAGLPVIASDFPNWRAVVEGHQCGLMVDPQDPEAIAAAMRYLLDHPAEAEAMGQRGRAAVAERYNWECQAEVLLAFYERFM